MINKNLVLYSCISYSYVFLALFIDSIFPPLSSQNHGFCISSENFSYLGFPSQVFSLRFAFGLHGVQIPFHFVRLQLARLKFTLSVLDHSFEFENDNSENRRQSIK